MKLEKIPLDQIIEDFLIPFKDQQNIEIKGSQDTFFSEQAALLKDLPVGIIIYPPNRMRRKNSMGVHIKKESAGVFFWIDNPYATLIELNGRIEGRRTTALKSNILKCSIPQLVLLFCKMLEHIEEALFDHKKIVKLNVVKKSALQKQLDSLLQNQQWNYHFVEEENKIALEISISRNRVIEFPFYYKSFQKDMSRLPEIIQNIELLKASITSIPNYIIVKHKSTKK